MFTYHEILQDSIKVQYINNIMRMVKLSGIGKAQCCNFKACMLDLNLKLLFQKHAFLVVSSASSFSKRPSTCTKEKE